ncbi:MAG TPA: hypothetical protein VGH74_12975 [Planctomycetaceae bacterium]|jgi:hypothetical protein
MGLKLRVKEAAWRVVKEEMTKYKIDALEHFPDWHAAAEFDIAGGPKSKLLPVFERHNKIHEYQSLQTVAGARYRVFWQIAWEQRDDDDDVFELLEITVTPIAPSLHIPI